MKLGTSYWVDGALRRFAAVVLIAAATLIFPIRNASDQLNNKEASAIDTSSPTFSAAAVNSAGTQLILQYSEALSATTASASSFAVTVAGSSRSVSSIAVAGSTVVLTLSSAVSHGQVATVSYTDPSGGNDASAVQDASGNDAASFSSTSVGGSNGLRQALIRAGYYHTCAVTSSGGVKCWGSEGTSGQHGDNTRSRATSPVQVTGLTSGVTAVATYGTHSCAITSSGGVKCWGDNAYRQLGAGSTETYQLTPVQVTGLTSGVTAITAGMYHTCALLSSGAVNCWGNNGYGQLGDGSITAQTAPTQVSGLTSGVTAISAGDTHTCALLATGAVKCWGSNDRGELGDGSTTDRLTPTQVSGLDSGVTAITTGDFHTCALLATGAVKCWGFNHAGQLGDGSTTTQNTPTQVSGLTSGVAAIAIAMDHSCALLATGAVKCWGENGYRQLGDGSTTDRLTPTQVNGLDSGVAAITTGRWHTCALLATGAINCWGENNGRLGDGTTANQSTPVEVVGGLSFGADTSSPSFSAAAVNSAGTQLILQYSEALSATTASASSFAVTVAEASRSVSSVAAAGSTMVLTLSSAVTMGQSVTVAYTDPSGGDDANAVQDASGNDAASISATSANNHTVGSQNLMSVGTTHSCALTPGGGAKCWGYAASGRLGNGQETVNATSPVDVSGLTNAVAIDGGTAHTCALTSSGGVKCWGSNTFGENGTGSARTTPTDVTGLTSGVAAISAGGFMTCALLVNGGVKCWGKNSNGQLGDGTTTDRSTPVDVVTSSTDSSPLRGVTAVSAAFAFSDATSHVCALMVNGGVKCWGFNTYGALGDGTTTSKSAPVNVVTSGTDQSQNLLSGISAISGGKHMTCAVTNSGTAKCWGVSWPNSNSTTLGNGTEPTEVVPSPSGHKLGSKWPVDVLASGTPSSSPVTLTGVSAVSVGYHHTCARMSSGGVKCWGNPYNGDGASAYRTTPVNVLSTGTDQSTNLLSGATAVSVGEYLTCVLFGTGAIQCWGSNSQGQVGDGTTTQRLNPVNVVGGFSFGADATAPTFVSAAVNTAGTKVILTYSEALSATTASASAFAVVVGGSSRSVSSVAVSGSTVELTLASAVATGESVTVAYTDPSGSNDANAVQDSAGNDAASLPAISVTNNADSVSPSFVSAATNSAGDQVTLTFGEALSSTTAAAGAFSVVVNGTAVTPSSVTVSGSTVVLAVSPAIQRGDTVTFAYTDPTNGNDANAVQDSIGNDVGSISTTSVTNSSTVDTRTPTFVSAATSADGTTITLTYSEALSATTASASAFAVVVGGSSRSVSSAVVSGSTVVLTLASAVGSGQSVTVAYTDPSGSNDANAVQDSAGNDAATLAATAVTNNVPTPTTTTVPASGGGASGGPSSGTTTSTTTTSTTTTTSSTVPAVVPTTLGNITTTTISRPRRTTTTTSTTVARRPSSATSTSTATNSSSITSTTIARAATTTTVFKPLVPLAPVTTVTRSTSPSTSVSASSSTSSTIALASPSTLVSPVTTITQRTVTNLSQAEKALETAKQAATSDIASAQMALADLRLSVIDPKSALAVAVNDAIRIVERLKTNDASPEQIAKAEERVTELKTGIAEAKSISVEGILDAQRAVEAVLNNPQASAAEVADAVSAFTVARTPDLDDVAAVLSGESQDATLPIVIRGVVDDPRVGNVVFLDDAQSKAMEIVTVNNSAVRLQSNQGFNLTIASRDSNGSPIQLGTNGAIVVRHDNFISVSGEGFAANSVAKTWLFSSPRELGVLEVRADGSFAADHPIGKDVKVGLHTAQINGLSPDGEVRSVSLSIEVLPNEGPAPYDPLNQPRTVLTLVAELVALLGVVGATSGMGGVSGRKREEEDDERESAEVAEVSVAFGSVGVDRVRDRLPVLVVDVVDRVSVGASRGVVGLSPMLARVFGDGVYLRSILGVLWLVLPFVGAGFGVGAASSSGFDAVMPSLLWLSALVVLGVFDAFSGFVGALVFGLAVGFGGGVVSGDSVRGLLGVWVFCFAAPLIAGAVRPFRRVRGGSAQIVWDRCVDFVLIVLFGAWVAGSMYSALPGLTGFNSLSAGYVNHVRVVVLVALAVRFVLENFAVAVTPVRLKALTREPLPEPTLQQKIVSAIVRTGVYMFVAVVFIGNNWALWLGGVLYLVPKLVGLGADKLPDMRTVHRYLPRGIFKVVLMLFVAKWWGGLVAAQVDNPADMIKFGFVLLGIPGLALGAVGWFARSSRPWPSTIVTKLLGTALLIIGVLVVLNIWEIL